MSALPREKAGAHAARRSPVRHAQGRQGPEGASQGPRIG
ncbi:hypothetical protein SLI_4125 [Streptomyces lividans 1326]|uniref:Uncharacterized protein n=1 Tax=Streptomyces lividans 1326 TaxID=1200984 RepID=A0A7U9HDL6_STRLI|nr:hypothetical protein SLI_4125 [Streptomyces lividans 1326]